MRATALIQNDTNASTIRIGMLRVEIPFDIARLNNHIISDHRMTFIVSTEPDAGHSFYMAHKRFSAARSSKATTSEERLWQLALSLSAVHWRIAVPRTNAGSDNYLRAEIESRMRTTCDVITRGQRCADWLVLIQFQITGTFAGIFPLATPMSSHHLSLNDPSPRTGTDIVKLLVSSWLFCSKIYCQWWVSQSIEGPVLHSLRSRDYVKDIQYCGMLVLHGFSWTACYPDGVSMIEEVAIGMDRFSELQMASVDTKTSVSSSIVDRTLQHTTQEIITCQVGDETFLKVITINHIGGILHKLFHWMWDTSSLSHWHFVLCVVKLSPFVRDFKQVLMNRVKPLIEWAYMADVVCLPEVDLERTRTVSEKLPFWRMVNFLIEKLPSLPSSYSNTGLSLSIPGQWVYLTLLLIIVQRYGFWWSFISGNRIWSSRKSNLLSPTLWKTRKHSDLLKFTHSFKGIERYCTSIHRETSLGNFVIKVSPKILQIAHSLSQIQQPIHSENKSNTEPKPDDCLHIYAAVREKKKILDILLQQC